MKSLQDVAPWIGDNYRRVNVKQKEEVLNPHAIIQDLQRELIDTEDDLMTWQALVVALVTVLAVIVILESSTGIGVFI